MSDAKSIVVVPRKANREKSRDAKPWVYRSKSYDNQAAEEPGRLCLEPFSPEPLTKGEVIKR